MLGIFKRKHSTPKLGPLTERDPVLDEHFRLSELVQKTYRARESGPAALDRAVAACEQQIAMQEKAAKALRLKGILKEGKDLPRHVGYEQLAILREKQGRLDDAVKLSQDAKKAGWSGDWDARIARLEKKRAKSS